MFGIKRASISESDDASSVPDVTSSVPDVCIENVADQTTVAETGASNRNFAGVDGTAPAELKEISQMSNFVQESPNTSEKTRCEVCRMEKLDEDYNMLMEIRDIQNELAQQKMQCDALVRMCGDLIKEICPRAFSTKNAKTSKKFAQKEPSTESSACKEETKAPLSVQNPFPTAELPTFLSDSYIPSISMDTCSGRSSTTSSEEPYLCPAHEPTDEESLSLDFLVDPIESSSFCNEYTKAPMSVQDPSATEELPKVLSRSYTKPVPMDTCSGQSSTTSNDQPFLRVAHTRAAANLPSSDCSGTIAPGKNSSTSLWVNANNYFFYSSTTRRIREHYTKLFDFEKFRHASSLSVNSYTLILNVNYLTIPFSRFLVEDLLDFVDFLNGTEVELREPVSNPCVASSGERQLAFVRENFAMGVQQYENQTFAVLVKEMERYIWKELDFTESKSHANEIVGTEYLRFFGLQINSDLSNSELETIIPNCASSDIQICRIRKLDQKINKMNNRAIVDRLEVLNEAIKRSVLRCISDTRMVLDFCIESENRRFDSRFKRYLTGVKYMLYRLNILRQDCVQLLQESEDHVDKTMVENILKVKVQIASVFLELLCKLLEVNTDFLGTVYI